MRGHVTAEIQNWLAAGSELSLRGMPSEVGALSKGAAM